MSNDDDSLDDNDRTRISFRATNDIKEEVSRLAKEQGVSETEIYRDAVKRYVKEKSYNEYRLKYSYEEEWETLLNMALQPVIEELRRLEDEIRRLNDEVLGADVKAVSAYDVSELRIAGEFSTDRPVLDDIDTFPRETRAGRQSSSEKGGFNLRNVVEAQSRDARPGGMPQHISGTPENSHGIYRPRPAPAAESPNTPPQQPSQPQSSVPSVPSWEDYDWRNMSYAKKKEKWREYLLRRQSIQLENKKKRLLYDDSISPPIVLGICLKSETSKYATYTDMSVWDKVNKKWARTGNILRKILKVEGRLA